MTNDELIARAEAVLEGVTEGLWVVEYKHGCNNLIMNGDGQMADKTYYPWTPDKLKDWEFFAASRDLVPALIAALKASEARVKALEAALRFIDDKVSWELNPSNYDHNDVCDLNADWIEVGDAARAALKGGAE